MARCLREVHRIEGHVNKLQVEQVWKLAQIKLKAQRSSRSRLPQPSVFRGPLRGWQPVELAL